MPLASTLLCCSTLSIDMDESDIYTIRNAMRCNAMLTDLRTI